MNGGREPESEPRSGRTDGQAPFAGLSVVVSIEDEAWNDRGLGDIEALSLDLVGATLRRIDLPADLATEASLTFTGDAEVKAINAEWRGKDTATNVLSFPMLDLEPGDLPGPMLGDLVFARETLEREAQAEGKTLRDHLCHLVVHGTMHCLGFDHVDPEDAEDMERLEIAILQDLGISDPYAMTEPADSAAESRLAS